MPAGWTQDEVAAYQAKIRDGRAELAGGDTGDRSTVEGQVVDLDEARAAQQARQDGAGA